MLDSDDLDSAMTEAGRNPRKGTRQANAEAEQRKKIQEPDREGRNKDVGGNMGHEAQQAGLPSNRNGARHGHGHDGENGRGDDIGELCS